MSATADNIQSHYAIMELSFNYITYFMGTTGAMQFDVIIIVFPIYYY